jgi:mono/diheme cytochrome c family protein
MAFLVALPVGAEDVATGPGVELAVSEEAPDPAGDPGEEVDEALLTQLREGAGVYTAVCSGCHQPGGAGLPGQFPPLVNNPRVDDGEYVAGVINGGLRGEIVVNGETYNGVMPAFSTLSDDETAAVIAYIQNDFQAPSDQNAPAVQVGPVAGTELPALANMGMVVAFLLAVTVAGLVLAPRLLSQNDRTRVPWLDAWLKTAVIVLAVVLLTVFVPDWALKTEAVSKLSRPAQDVIGVSLWGAGLAVVIGGLWYAHRESRV